MLTVTDLFAGAGGSSTGMVQIPGVRVRIAANHLRLACEVHNANHPTTDHATVDLHAEDPRFFPETDILWASPECTKWSQANGSKLPAIEEGLFADPNASAAATQSRLLMFDVLRYIEHHRYRLVFIENVVDIARAPKYRTAWRVWQQDLANLGYRWRVISLNAMHAQLNGDPAPQSRDRIFIAAWPAKEPAPDFEAILRPKAYCPRCDTIVESQQSWKNGRTVGKYRQQYVYVHGACGTVVEPGFLPALNIIDWSVPGELIGDRLMPKTRLRIAHGIAKWWGPIHLEASGNQYDAADPKHPQHGDPNAYYRAWPVEEYLRTLHTGETKALAIPVEGRDGKQALPIEWPMRTQTTRAETGLALHPHLIAELRGGGSTARPATHPLATVTAGGNHHALVSPYYGASRAAQPINVPLGTLTTVDRYALVHRNNSGGAEMTTPVFEELRTLTTAAHQSLIQSGPHGGRPSVSPTDLTRAMEMVPGCYFRMLQPHEVGAGMAFPSDYQWDVEYTDDNGKTKRPTKRETVKLMGNAVCPPCSRDLMAVGAEYLNGQVAA